MGPEEDRWRCTYCTKRRKQDVRDKMKKGRVHEWLSIAIKLQNDKRCDMKRINWWISCFFATNKFSAVARNYWKIPECHLPANCRRRQRIKFFKSFCITWKFFPILYAEILDLPLRLQSHGFHDKIPTNWQKRHFKFHSGQNFVSIDVNWKNCTAVTIERIVDARDF